MPCLSLETELYNFTLCFTILQASGREDLFPIQILPPRKSATLHTDPSIQEQIASTTCGQLPSCELYLPGSTAVIHTCCLASAQWRRQKCGHARAWSVRTMQDLYNVRHVRRWVWKASSAHKTALRKAGSVQHTRLSKWRAADRTAGHPQIETQERK